MDKLVIPHPVNAKIHFRVQKPNTEFPTVRELICGFGAFEISAKAQEENVALLGSGRLPEF